MQSYHGWGCKYPDGFTMQCDLCKFNPDLFVCNEHVKSKKAEKIRPEWWK